MHPPPPAPPNRPNAAAFHYHTYSYPGDVANGPFQPSGGLASAGGWQFYSLVQDLQGLVAWGNANNVPNLALTAMSAAGGAQTLGGRETLVLSFGPAAGVVNAPAAVFTGGVHAREWIAAEFAYLLAEYLIKHYSTAPQGPYQTTIRNLVNSRRIYVIPMLNPDGNDYTVFTAAGAGRLWRKNRRPLPTTPAAWVNLLTNNGALGVNPPPFMNVQAPGAPPGALAQYDVPVYAPGVPPGAAVRHTRQLASNAAGVDANRNFTTLAWGYDGQRVMPPPAPAQPGFSFDPSRDPYFGPAVCSEVESSNLQISLNNAHPGITVFIDYHSYGKLIVYPSETHDNGGVGPEYTLLGQTLRQLVRSQAALDYQLGTPRQLIGYDAPATSIDRAAQQHQARAFTIELDPQIGNQIAFRLPEGDICGVFEKNIRGALAALAAPLNPANIQVAQQFYAHILQEFLGWDVYGRGNRLPL